jgi:hypothetical protein
MKKDDVTIVHGGCEGADILADQAAKLLGFKTIVVLPDWKRYGRGAGPVRNKQMVDMKPDLVLVFHDSLSKSKGTKNCANLGVKACIKTLLYGSQ